jgi:2-polyprenyl-6-methoxyphenol hydroxylase-like FAD-dependent oxidoreductase
VYDAIIVGGGVGGLAAAATAGRANASVLVLDRHRTPPPVHKGEFLQPRTLEVLAGWGVVDALLAKGAVRIDGLECRDASGRFLGAFDYRRLVHPFNCGLLHYYGRIRESLMEQAERVAEVRFGVRVTGLAIGRDGRVGGVLVEGEGGEQRIEARLVVGADGPASTVRQRLNLAARRRPYDHQFIAFDVPGPRLPPRILNFLTRRGARIAYPMPEGRARLYVQVPAGDAAAARRLDAEGWRRLLLEDCPPLGDLFDLAPADLERRQWFIACRADASRWDRPGAVLIGDAAHLIHPMAGQGMNASIVDGWTLFRTIAELDGLRSRRALDDAVAAYGTRRRAQMRVTNRISHRLSLLCTATSAVGYRLSRRILLHNRDNERLLGLAAAAMAGVPGERFTSWEWLQVLAHA